MGCPHAGCVGPEIALSRATTTPLPATLRPVHLSAPRRARVSAVIDVVRRARRRLWWAGALGRLAYVAAPAMLAYAGWALAARAGLWPAAWDVGAALVLAIAGLLGVAWAMGRRPGWLAAAGALDLRVGGGDHISTALDLARQGRDDPFAMLQARHAESAAAGLDLVALLPMPRPAGLGWVVAGAVAAMLALVVPQVWLLGDRIDGQRADGLLLDLPPGHAGVVVAAELLGADALELLRADAELIADVAAQVDDAPTRAWLHRVKGVLEDVESGKLDRRAALAKLAELEAERPEPPEQARSGDPSGDPNQPVSREAAAAAERDRDRAVQKALSKAVEKAIEAAPEGATRDELERAAKKGDLGLMAKALEKLADRDMSDKELEGWVKAAEKLAKALGAKEVPKQFQQLADRIRRLEQKRQQQGGLTPAENRRLHNARRAMDALRREHGDVAGAGRQLQRLERGARQAADEMRRMQQERSRIDRQKGGGAEGEARRQQQRKALAGQVRQQMQRAAQEMRRQGQGQRERQARRIGDGRLRDLRQALRRAGERGRSQRRDFADRARGQQSKGQRGEEGGGKQGEEEGRDAQSGQRGEPRDGAGKQGRAAAEAAAKERAAARRRQAAGQGESGGPSQPGGSGRKRSTRLGQGELSDDRRMQQMADGQQLQQQGGGDGGRGKTYGHEDGRDLEGKGARKGTARTEQVRGKHGEGPSTKDVFVDAARKGFARTGWREVYSEYAEVAQEMLEKESLPPGRKAMVRRYYELIRPRAAQTQRSTR
ncbi:MAG: hypothetical protein RIT45_3909 [Pseudomonadota bacterium]